MRIQHFIGSVSEEGGDGGEDPTVDVFQGPWDHFREETKEQDAWKGTEQNRVIIGLICHSDSGVQKLWYY